MPAASIEPKHEREVASLARRKADQFFDRLASNPFIAIIVEDDRVHIYAREDVGPEELEQIKSTIAEMTKETDVASQDEE